MSRRSSSASARTFYAARTNPERRVRQHVREQQALGYSVTLNPAA